MRIQYRRLDDAHKEFDALRAVKRSCPSAPQDFVTAFAPSHSGKSMLITTYIENVIVDEAISRGLFKSSVARTEIAQKQRLVLHVTLQDGATKKSIASDILRALGDPNPTRGTADTLLQRAYDLLRKHGVELVVIDEIQQLAGGMDIDRRTGSKATNTLKIMLIRGLVPMVFMGLDKAEGLMEDDQLSGRRISRLNIGALNPADISDCNAFREYCGKTGILLKKIGIFQERSNFVSDYIVDCIFEVSKGFLGIASRLMMHASFRARALSAPSVTVDHLSYATDLWAIRERKIIDRNPFVGGPRTKLAGLPTSEQAV